VERQPLEATGIVTPLKRDRVFGFSVGARHPRLGPNWRNEVVPAASCPRVQPTLRESYVRSKSGIKPDAPFARGPFARAPFPPLQRLVRKWTSRNYSIWGRHRRAFWTAVGQETTALPSAAVSCGYRAHTGHVPAPQQGFPSDSGESSSQPSSMADAPPEAPCSGLAFGEVLNRGVGARIQDCRRSVLPPHEIATPGRIRLPLSR